MAGAATSLPTFPVTANQPFFPVRKRPQALLTTQIRPLHRPANPRRTPARA